MTGEPLQDNKARANEAQGLQYASFGNAAERDKDPFNALDAGSALFSIKSSGVSVDLGQSKRGFARLAITISHPDSASPLLSKLVSIDERKVFGEEHKKQLNAWLEIVASNLEKGDSFFLAQLDRLIKAEPALSVEKVEHVDLQELRRVDPGLALEEGHIAPHQLNPAEICRVLKQERYFVPPSALRDSLTGLRTKAVFSSPEAVAELEKNIPGPKLIISLDFKAMGPTDKCGLGEKVDTLLRAQLPIAASAFSQLKHEVFRTGGDELGIIIEDRGTDTRVALKLFMEMVNKARDELLSSSHTDQRRVRSAKFQTAVRTVSRTTFKDYKNALEDKGEVFSTERFAEYLKKLYQGQDTAAHPNAVRYHTYELITDKFFSEAAKIVRKDQVGLLELNASAVRVSDPLTVELCALAFNQGDLQIHHLKEDATQNQNESELGTDLNAKAINIVIRDAERAAITNSIQNEKTYREIQANLPEIIARDAEPAKAARQALHELTQAVGGDPSSVNVLRANLIWNFKAGEVFDIRIPTDLHVLTFDLCGFGCLNNQFGSARADDVFQKMVSIAREELSEDYHCVRLNGGRFDLVFKNAPDPRHVDKAKERMIDYIDSLRRGEAASDPAGTQRIKEQFEQAESEYELRQGLAQAFREADAGSNYFAEIIADYKKLNARPGDAIRTLWSNK